MPKVFSTIHPNIGFHCLSKIADGRQHNNACCSRAQLREFSEATQRNTFLRVLDLGNRVQLHSFSVNFTSYSVTYGLISHELIDKIKNMRF